MFNGPKRTASGAETISSQQDMSKLQGEANKVAERISPSKKESEEETPLSDCKTVRPEKSDSDDTKAPAPPLKRKRGRPKKSDSSGIKDAAENGEQPGKTAEMGLPLFLFSGGAGAFVSSLSDFSGLTVLQSDRGVSSSDSFLLGDILSATLFASPCNFDISC